MRPLAITLAISALSLVSLDVAQADVITFTANFPGQSKGAGTFQVAESCLVCDELTGLSEFRFSVDGLTFESEGMTYFRDRNALSGSLKSGREHLVFTPSGQLHYASDRDGGRSVWHGEYEIDEQVFSSTPVSAEIQTPLITNPEPSSILLLVTVLGSAGLLAARKKQRANF